jgi:hypothetical protein
MSQQLTRRFRGPRRHESERKRKVTKYEEQKIIHEKKLSLYIDDDIGSHVVAEV